MAAFSIAAVSDAMPSSTTDVVVAPPIEDPILDKIWTTADGRQIKIRDLEDDHLVNIIKFISNRQSWINSDVYAHNDKKLMMDLYRVAQSRRLELPSMSSLLKPFDWTNHVT
jgi:hypothetical protein